MALYGDRFDSDDLFILLTGCVIQTTNSNEGPQQAIFRHYLTFYGILHQAAHGAIAIYLKELRTSFRACRLLLAGGPQQQRARAGYPFPVPHLT